MQFEKGNAYISTSSVAGALYARTCLKSRAFYRDMWIKFYEDECSKPVPRARRRRSAAVAKAAIPKKDRGLFYNPYSLLSDDEVDRDADDEDDEDN